MLKMNIMLCLRLIWKDPYLEINYPCYNRGRNASYHVAKDIGYFKGFNLRLKLSNSFLFYHVSELSQSISLNLTSGQLISARI